MRQTVQRFGVIGCETEGIGQRHTALTRFIELVVVARQISYTELAHQFIAALHFTHTPIQTIGGLAHVGDHRCQQMRNAFIDRHLQHLGVNHQHAHIARFGFVEQRQNHGVDTHRLARTRGARHQDMRHFGQICHHGVAANVFAQAHGQHGFGFVVNRRAQDFTQAYGLAFAIRQLQRHEVFPWNGFHHTYGHHAERTRQIFGQIHHLRAFDTGSGLNFITGHHRAGSGGQHFDFHTKVA